MRSQNSKAPARPAGFTKRDEQQNNMLHISWLAGENRWQAKIPYKDEYGKSKHKYLKKGGLDWRVALAELIPLRDAEQKGIVQGKQPLLGKGKHMTVAQWVEEYLATSVNIEANTREGYAGLLRDHVCKYLGHIPLVGLTEGQVNHWLAEMIEKSGDPEVRFGLMTPVMALKRFKTCLEVAVDRKFRDDNPARRCSITKLTKRRKVNKLANYKTDPSETARLVAACGPTYMAAMILLATDVGMRRSEIVALRWIDLDLEAAQPTITFRNHAVTFGAGANRRTNLSQGTKTSDGKMSTRPVTPFVAQALLEARTRLARHWDAAGKKWRAGQVGRGGYVIPSNPIAPEALVFPMADGDMYDPGTLNNWFVQTICRRAGITTKSIHSLRHDCATFMLAKGAPLTVVSHHMRHSNPQITATTYSHLISSQDTLATSILGGIWGEAFAAQGVAA
jgi:integrase